MNTNKKNGRRVPVAIMGRSNARRRRMRTGPLDAEPTTEPLPGPMLVLLSRLHRAELPPPELDSAEREDPSG